MPNIIGGGQSFVQASNNNGGGMSRGMMIIGSLFGTKANLEMRKHLITHQTNESIRKEEATQRSKAIYGAAGKATESLMGNEAVIDFYKKVYERYGENHPDVLAGTKKATDYINPELAAHATEAGVVRTPGPLGTQFGSTAGERAANARRKAAEGESNTPTGGEGAEFGNPPKKTSSKKTKTPKMGEEGFEGYTPRKTGTGGYDEALKEGMIDKDTYDSYVEDAAKGPKHYMPKQASNAVDTLVKERQNAAGGRASSFDIGSKEHKTNVVNAWAEGKITSEEASDLSESGSESQKYYDMAGQDNSEEITRAHKAAGLDNEDGVKY